MTCIVGFIENGVTYIGSDSLGSNGYSGKVYKGGKVFHIDNKNDIISGYTSSYRMGQLLKHSSGLFDKLSLIENSVNERYMVNNFIPRIQDLFKSGGYQTDKSGQKGGGVFLLGFKDRLYKIQEDYSVLETDDEYDACGSGEDFALGALSAIKDLKLNPKERMRIALNAASKFSVGVSPPFYMVNTSTNETEML